jgi:dienelactone hydrolase
MNIRPRPPRLSLLLLAGLLLAAGIARGETPRVLPAGKQPADQRLEPLKTLNDYFPFTPPKTREQWAERSERLRRQLLVATGLWPMPTATPTHAVVYGAVDRDGYTVEKVFLESFPGHFVCGNLYRPKGRTGRLPGVLCPHGHWPNGRFYDMGAKAVRQAIADGAERFEIGGRYPLQARCVQLARMGCVVFHYDMEGYADSQQLAHRSGNRPELSTPESWVYFSPPAEARLQTMMGLQTYNSIRALDWFSQRDDVDPRRIGVTGASGGGTQTFLLCAIDLRPAVAFPAVMVSTAMQGGCTCENACYLRVGTGNVELAALIAPRPLGMTAANDWTKEIATKGLPELQQLYHLLGADKLVMAKPLVQFPHNYNYVSREVMYHWMNRHLRLGLPEPILEEDYKPLTVAEMSVWDDAHPRPPSGVDYERALVKWITDDSQRQMQALIPTQAASLAKYREVVGGAADILIGRRVPGPGEVHAEITREYPAFKTAWKIQAALLRYAAAGEEVPAIVLTPTDWNKQVVLWITTTGKQDLFDPQGIHAERVEQLLRAKVAVVGIDLFGQGEFTADGKPLAKARLNASGRGQWAQYAGFTYGYNDPLFAQRVHDILTAIAFARDELHAEKIHLVGLHGAGHWVLAARTQAGAAVDRVAADTAGFRFANLKAIDDPDFLPGGAKYLDLPGLAALSAGGPLWLAGEGDQAPAVVAAAYRAAGKPEALTAFGGPENQRDSVAVKWLLQ